MSTETPISSETPPSAAGRSEGPDTDVEIPDDLEVPLPGMTKSGIFEGVTEIVPIDSLLPADSPRLSGEDADHVEMLANCESVLPPILVDRSTRRVVDGMHRLMAARMRGGDTIEVQFFDAKDDAFVIAVTANTTHGLPLSTADREAAAARIIRSHARWSDRSIATVTGLAARTVRTIRGRTGGSGHSDTRLGRDGRVRPVNSAERRRYASELLREKPDQSMREIAKVVGISPATVRDVRDRLKRGEDPVPANLRVAAAATATGTTTAERTRPATARMPGVRRSQVRDRTQILENLRKDPSLRYTESGRMLLRWLDAHIAGPDGWSELIASTPAHCAYVVAEFAQGCANEWLAFAQELRTHACSAE